METKRVDVEVHSVVEVVLGVLCYVEGWGERLSSQGIMFSRIEKEAKSFPQDIDMRAVRAWCGVAAVLCQLAVCCTVSEK